MLKILKTTTRFAINSLVYFPFMLSFLAATISPLWSTLGQENYFSFQKITFLKNLLTGYRGRLDLALVHYHRWSGGGRFRGHGGAGW